VSASFAKARGRTVRLSEAVKIEALVSREARRSVFAGKSLTRQCLGGQLGKMLKQSLNANRMMR